MNLGHVTFNYKPIVGGAETYLCNLIKVFEEKGYDQRVYQRDNGVYSEELILIPKLTKLIPKQVGFNIGLVSKYPELFREDVLIVNYPEHYWPVMWHPNVILLTHGVNWTSEVNKKKKIIRKLSAKAAFKMSKKFVANDTFFLREMGLQIKPRTNLFSEVDKGVWFIPNCVDISHFSRTDGITEIKKMNPIIVPRNFSYSRGIDLAVKAFARFNEKYPETTLLLVGDALPGMKSSLDYKYQLKKLVDEYKLKEKVIFWGSVKWTEMPDIFSSSLMTLIPTRSGEGTSLSALESMACETATITTAVEGLLDLPSVHCSPTVEGLAQTMFEVFSQREKVANEQCGVVREVYNMKNWANAWLKVVNSRR